MGSTLQILIRPARNSGVFAGGRCGVLTSTKCATTLHLTSDSNLIDRRRLDHRVLSARNRCQACNDQPHGHRPLLKRAHQSSRDTLRTRVYSWNAIRQTRSDRRSPPSSISKDANPPTTILQVSASSNDPFVSRLTGTSRCRTGFVSRMGKGCRGGRTIAKAAGLASSSWG